MNIKIKIINLIPVLLAQAFSEGVVKFASKMENSLSSIVSQIVLGETKTFTIKDTNYKKNYKYNHNSLLILIDFVLNPLTFLL